ncbi:MAG: type IV conjugative transfer system lipoprotein TraV [Rhodanobacter sp.]
MRTLMKLALIGCSTLALSGCIFGKTKYECPAPTGAACMPVNRLYSLTNEPGQAGIDSATGAVEPGHSKKRKVVADAPIDVGPQMSAHVAPVPQPGDVVPIRAPARVMRIWVAPWQDENGDLHAASRMFVEIEPQRWAMGQEMVETPKSFFPAQVVESPKSKDTSAATPGDGVVMPASGAQ